MKYKIILEAEVEDIRGAAALLAEISERLSGGNMKVALLDICGASSSTEGDRAPTRAEVEAYFGTLLLPRGASAHDEAMRFYGYNASSGWKYAAIWQKLARDWVARIRVGGSAATSFDVEEFFGAAVAKSMGYKEDDHGKSK